MRRSAGALLLVVLAWVNCRQVIVPQRKQPAEPALAAASVATVSAPALATMSPAAAVSPATGDSPALGDSRANTSVNCVKQAAQQFLIDAHLSSRTLTNGQAYSEWATRLQRSIRYRTEQYGYYSGFGLRSWNTRSLAQQMRVTKFAGLPVVLHERVIPALQCVERAIARDCPGVPYRPRSLGGMRQTNTYFGGDVSNHVYGIALDVDPMDNPCCNCVEPWRSNPKCRGKKSDWQRMAMPQCWVSAFEQYGFYWLGHDELKDTMHFEFLGEPSKFAPPRTD